ncbi:acyl carrier protein [Saccharopolyspora sp. ASAGF58]|uniref:acyl carrier protein n=1 Tax=Saccharopolyspora sp. ASAGF58 TaxID=2719023 RepID=UPI001444C850|nr:phosphopantetheine-binding protein [Saccharopolyspora sp. ASAGF58]
MRGNENVLDGTDDVMDELKKLVTELTDLPAGALTSAASLATDLGLDDLAVAQILVEAELRFGVQIPDRIVRPGLQELADYIRAEARKENT